MKKKLEFEMVSPSPYLSNDEYQEDIFAVREWEIFDDEPPRPQGESANAQDP